MGKSEVKMVNGERKHHQSYSKVDDIFLETSESDIKAIKNKTAELMDNYGRLRESNTNTKRRMASLQSEFEGAKARLEILMHRKPRVTPDYQAYQIMRRISRTNMQRKSSHQSDS